MIISHLIEDAIKPKKVNYSEVMGSTWCANKTVSDLLMSDYMDNLVFYIDQTYKRVEGLIYPKAMSDIFKPFRLTPLKEIKAVIVADEPYKNVYANGLAFGNYPTHSGSIFTPELQVIEKVLLDTYHDGANIIFQPSLEDWARQGVLLLNSSLISERSSSMNKQHNFAFNYFAKEIIRAVSDDGAGIAFAFTSKELTKNFESLIDKNYHRVFTYDGITHDTTMFDDINEFLIEDAGEHNKIEWI